MLSRPEMTSTDGAQNQRGWGKRMYSAVSKGVRHLLLRPMPAMTQIALKHLLASRRAHAVRLTETMVRSVCAGGGTRACSVSARQCAAALPHNRICRKGADVCSGERACPCSSVMRGPVVRNVSAGGGTGSRVPGRAASQQGGALLLCPPTGSAEMVLNVIWRAGMPMLLYPERTVGAQRLRRRGDPGVQRLSITMRCCTAPQQDLQGCCC